MAKAPPSKPTRSSPKVSAKTPTKTSTGVGAGGEPHQHSGTPLTTNHGMRVSDDQNTLRAGVRGPSLLEDFHFLEKMTHFDHERIPARVVHARGSAAHGTFVAYKAAAEYSRAAFLQPGVETPVFTRFSTVAGGAGSIDTPRDVRGFATKFYTQEGNFDLVGNNIPVFFIQDAIKFPDFVHSVKMEPDRGFPQNASAHDTFWDFVSLASEAQHMVMWAMSDRTLPRSLRMMECFGIHTFRLLDADGTPTLVKWHWRPSLGMQSTTWDEAVKIAGADQDFHRRDLWEAITSGAFPSWELMIQPIAEEDVDGLPYDILDPTKLVPEEDYPLIAIGKMTLNRWPENFFAETEQVAFHPGHLVPGIDVTNDPLLQGRLFSYTDTQLKRIGGPNFHELEINKPKCPMRNFQRDGMARQAVDRGRTNYEHNSLESDGPRETPSGYVTYPDPLVGPKIRQRSETFADHHTQARMFYRSQTPVEQSHIANAYTFELAKVASEAVRRRQLGHLDLIDAQLGATVADKLGMAGQAQAITPVKQPFDMEPSPALSILGKAAPTLEGRKVGILISDGCDAALVAKLRAAIAKAGATAQLVAPKVGKTTASNGTVFAADHMIAGGPSVIFDAVAVVVGGESVASVVANPAAVQWASDAFHHCKVMGVVGDAQPLLDAAGAKRDEGVIDLAGKGVEAFIQRARAGRIWAREAAAQVPPETTKRKR
ncbi:catalase [soil metagenome]